MTKQELQEQVERLQQENQGMAHLLIDIRMWCDRNLDPFRNGLVDKENEMNKGIFEALTKLAELYNSRANFNKIDLSAFNKKCRIINIADYRRGK